MTRLADHLSTTFPELRLHPDEFDQPYALMARLVDFLRLLPLPPVPSDLSRRLEEFAHVCELEPRTDSPETDLFTVFVVGLLEPVLADPRLYALAPSLIDLATLRANERYVRDWTQPGTFERALATLSALQGPPLEPTP